MSAENGHGNPGVQRAGGIIAVLAALALGFILMAIALDQTGAGIAGLINKVGDALTEHPRMGFLLGIFSLGMLGGITALILKSYDK